MLIDRRKADQHECCHEGDRAERLPPSQPLTEPEKSGGKRNQRIDRAHRAGHCDLTGLPSGGERHQCACLAEPGCSRPSNPRPTVQPAGELGTERDSDGQCRDRCAVRQHRGWQPAGMRRVPAQHEYAPSVRESRRTGKQETSTALMGHRRNLPRTSGPPRICDQSGGHSAHRKRDARGGQPSGTFAQHHYGQHDRHSSVARGDRTRHAYRPTLERRVVGEPPGQDQHPSHHQAEHSSPAVHTSRTHHSRENIQRHPAYQLTGEYSHISAQPIDSLLGRYCREPPPDSYEQSESHSANDMACHRNLRALGG